MWVSESVCLSVCHTKRVERSTDRSLPPIFSKLAATVESQDVWLPIVFGGNLEYFYLPNWMWDAMLDSIGTTYGALHSNNSWCHKHGKWTYWRNAAVCYFLQIVDLLLITGWQVCVHGRHVFMGYLNNERETLEALGDDGWLYTGDIGKLDDDGFLFITGRLKGSWFSYIYCHVNNIETKHK